MKKWLVVTCVLGVVLASAALLGRLHRPRPWRPGITRENFDHIPIGMRQADVEAILGGPPGDYNTKDGLGYYPPFEGVVYRERLETWRGDEALVDLWFDAGGAVVRKRLYEVGDQEE